MHLRRTIIFLALFFGSTTTLFATPSGGYTPGSTLDPDCAPGSTADCIVRSLEAQDEGTSLTSNALVFNFTGAGVTATESGGVVTVDISGSSGGLTSLNGLTGGTQTFAIGSSGTSPAWSSSGTTHTLNLPTASGTNTGILSASDWTTFNNKQAALELYRENPSTPTTPVASGANAVAIGSLSTASGTASFAAGYDAQATASNAVAVGNNVDATGSNAIAFGYDAHATVADSMAFGRGVTATAGAAIGLGSNAHATGAHSSSLGSFSDATQLYSTALGAFAQATGSYSTAIGYSAAASGSSSAALGVGAIATGVNSMALGTDALTPYGLGMAFGIGITVQSRAEMVLGYYSTNYTAQSTGAVDDDDRLFTIGNGRDNLNRADALSILKNGNMSIGIDNWEADLDAPDVRLKVEGPRSSTVAIFSDGLDTCEITPSTAGGVTCSSDARLKKDIETITQDTALDDINALRPVHYFWNDDANESNPQQGFIAQEIREVFPELVRTGNNGMLSVSYVGLIPSIVASIQELTEKVANMFTHLTTDNVTIHDTLCLDDVCITKEELQEILNNGSVESSDVPVEDTIDEEILPDTNEIPSDSEEIPQEAPQETTE